MTSTEFDQIYLKTFNAQQIEAVHSVDGAVLLLAVPGSGKTTVLVTRLGYMIHCHSIPTQRILTMTYTVAATVEMRQRFVDLFGKDIADGMQFCTINSLSAQIIRRYARTYGSGHPFELIPNDAAAAMVGRIYRELHGEYPTESTIKDIRTGITYIKNMMLSDEELDAHEFSVSKMPQLYRRYCGQLKREQRMDFDDQMGYALTILKSYPDILAEFQDRYPYLCVDEAQDTSKIQHQIIGLLCAKHGNLFMVGDEDQSIYGFRAAYPQALLDFELEHPGAKILLMEQNYRSTQAIVSAANSFVSKNLFRRDKLLRPNRPEGAPLHLIRTCDRIAQYKFLFQLGQRRPADTAILYRNNDSALPLIDLFERSGVPYVCKRFENTFFTHRVIADLVDILHLSIKPDDPQRFLRIYYKFGFPITKSAAESACRRHADFGTPILEALAQCPELSGYGREGAETLRDLLPSLPKQSAQTALRQIWSILNYQSYVNRNKLDSGKFDILYLLAEQVADPSALLERLEALQHLVDTHQDPEGPAIILSTVHSSKGLEYPCVYLLDILDGVLPSRIPTGDMTPEESAQYQEERRIFYVAMTRAKDDLYLFQCPDRPSQFVRELLSHIPSPAPDPEDLFHALHQDLCRRSFRHVRFGKGRIIAHCGDTLLVEYPGKRLQLAPLWELYAQRAPVTISEPATPSGTPAAPTGEESICVGSSVTHRVFGTGVVLGICQGIAQVRFDSDGQTKQIMLGVTLRSGILQCNG